jgi:hypothetical protein
MNFIFMPGDHLLVFLFFLKKNCIELVLYVCHGREGRCSILYFVFASLVVLVLEEHMRFVLFVFVFVFVRFVDIWGIEKKSRN